MTEATELPLRCRCGTVRGVARDFAPSKVNHCFCYCDDCQAFAHFLDREGDVLDEHGLPEPVMVARVLAKLLGWRLRGDHKRSALFDAASGKPLAEPRVLGAAEREALRQRCAQWRGEAAGGG